MTSVRPAPTVGVVRRGSAPSVATACPIQSSASVKLRNPGPATSARAIAGWPGSAARTASATARGLARIAFATRKAWLLCQSPCRGSAVGTAGSGTSSTSP